MQKSAINEKEYANLNEQIDQRDFSSIFEFLKAIRYKEKKQKRYEELVLKSVNNESQDDERKNSPGPQEILNKIFMSKQRDDEKNKDEKKPRGITAPWDEPHSIIDEVFSWSKTEMTRDKLIQRSNTTEKISTPKMNTRSLMTSPGQSNTNLTSSCYSPMTLSRAAVKSMGDPSQSSQFCGWPILQGHLNIQELILASDKTVKQFKNLGDMLAVSFLEQHCVKASKKGYFIFFKGKLYKFKSQNDQNCKVINIKYCQIDLISLQRPTQTVVFGGKFGGAGSAGLNLEQCIIIRFQNKCIVLTAVADTNQMKSVIIKRWFDLLKYFGVLQNLKCHYDIGNIIGKGNFAKVYEIKNSATKRKFALKTINKAMFKDNIKSVMGIHDEISLLRKIRHPNVLQLYEIFESEANIHLILEHLNGKELFDQIKERGQYREMDAATILRCILNALVVLHSNQIVHRDLKPENLIFRDDNLNSLVIIDFGLSTTCKDGPQFTRCGSPGYVAPEILNNLGYGCKVDIFSVGVIMYILLTSKFVFNARDYNEILRKNKQCKVQFPAKLWEHLSPQAQDLCSKMLQKQPENRVSALEALDHQWFKTYKEKGNIQQIMTPITAARKEIKMEFEEKDKMIVQTTEQDQIISKEQEEGSASVEVGDLVTSSPLMNKKKMMQGIKQMGKIQLEQDKMNTFQTPLPQMRFAQKSNGVDPRLQKLLGGGAQQKLSNGLVMNNLAGETQPSDAMKQRLGLSNNLASRANQIQNSVKEPIGQMMHKQFMTPALNSTNQFQQRQISEQTSKNRAELLGMVGLKPKDPNTNTGPGNLQQIEESQRGEDLQTPSSSVVQVSSNINTQSKQKMFQMMIKSGTSNFMQKSNAGGTGAPEDDVIEDEYIVTFSDEADDSQIMNVDNKNIQMTLNQQLQKQQKALQNQSKITILQGVDSLISNPSMHTTQNNQTTGGIHQYILQQKQKQGQPMTSFSQAQKMIFENMHKKQQKQLGSEVCCNMGPKKIIYRQRSQIIPEQANGPSKHQHKLSHLGIQNMYKPSESGTNLDDFDVKMTPPQQKKSQQIINTQNLIQGHAIFRETSPKIVSSPPSTNSRTGGKANNIRNKLLKNMI